MAEGEFWLPSDFLSDDFTDDKTVMSLRSPLDSESDEDDTLTGLTRQMADSFLNPSQTADQYSKTMASSPQSTLCPSGIWSGSSNGSPTGASQLSSPPETPLEQHKGDLAWDIPPPIGGEATRGGGGIFVAPGFYSNSAVTHKSQQAERFYHLQQQQLIKQQLSATWGRQQQQNRAKSGGAPLGLPLSAWPLLGKQQQQHHPQPQQSRSGFRAVFLTGSGQRESTGTGVFLPRRPGTPAERKKPPCSTVLLPDRVIQALNLKLDEIGHHQPRFAVNHVGSVARGKQFPVQQQKEGYYRVASSSTPAVGGGNVEVSLPAEWTY